MKEKFIKKEKLEMYLYKPQDKPLPDILNKKNSVANKTINPYPHAKSPVTDSITIVTTIEALEIFSNIKLLNNDNPFGLKEVDELRVPMKILKEYLLNRQGTISSIDSTIYDCSLAMENGACEEITTESINDYAIKIQEALTNQSIPLDSSFSAKKMDRDAQKVYGHMDVSIPIKMKINFSYIAKTPGDKINIDYKNPEPETDPTPIGKNRTKKSSEEKSKPNPNEKRLTYIYNQIKALEESITYMDPIRDKYVTRKVKDTLYGIWYMEHLQFFMDRISENNDYTNVVEQMLIGRPEHFECWNPDSTANMQHTNESWNESDFKEKVFYFNETLDEKISLAKFGAMNPEYYRRVEKAYEDGEIPLMDWRTGIFVTPYSKFLHPNKLHSIKMRGKRFKNDRRSAETIGNFAREFENNDEGKILERQFNNKLKEAMLALFYNE
ncbi:MAG: hypothetical protein ACI8ZM_001005 [Crocinitomix sp.]